LITQKQIRLKFALSIPKAHLAGVQLVHTPTALGAGAGLGPGDHLAASTSGAAPHDVNITTQGTGVGFPHHHVNYSFTVKAGHGLGDDEIPSVLTPGDLGLIAALLAAEFEKSAHSLSSYKFFCRFYRVLARVF